jgi:hypothetical protein
MAVSPDEITKWKEDNPDDLYVRVKGTSINIENNIKNSYEELVTGAELVGGDEGKEMMLTTLNNFAPMYLISNNSRREVYTRFSASIRDAVDNNESRVFEEGPAAWKNNGDGTHTGHLLQFVIKNGEVNVVPYELIRDAKGNVSEPKMIKGAATTLNYGAQNLPITLLKLNLTYGTGREADLVKVRQGYDEVPFVPAFTSTFNGTASSTGVFKPGTTIR